MGLRIRTPALRSDTPLSAAKRIAEMEERVSQLQQTVALQIEQIKEKDARIRTMQIDLDFRNTGTTLSGSLNSTQEGIYALGRRLTVLPI